MSEKISVVIPVYKVEAYLAECLDSVIKQTYQNTEIILVDDASPDGCGKICDRYAAGDSRIKVVHREKNGGLAEARNTGMDHAVGDYIFFVDSDDWLAENTLEMLYEGLNKYKADCCCGACVTVLERKNGEKSFRRGKQRGERCETAHEAMEHVLLAGSSSCNRLYKREVLEGLRFPQGRINEDEPLVLRAYERMERIVFLECETYFYRKRANSITTSAFSVKMADCVYNSKENLEFVTREAPELIPAGEYKYCKSLLWCYVNLRKLKGDRQAEALRRQFRNEIKEIRKTALVNPYLKFPLKVLAFLCRL